MFNSILVVCTGNICRSPIAERILSNAMKNLQINSAGLGALIGHSADLSAIRVAEKNGVSLEGHKGKQFSSEMARQYDLVLVMDKGHLERISQIAPEIRGKTMLLGHWLNKSEIPDPYKQSDEAFDFVYKLIEQSCKLWIEKIIG
ncbi:arsenate reductase/protein-tyrosine-phosphatase family protein [Klebsiella aerogenes]|uniref:arsenate reductase/protein-tyrosine-phosphatase family protein n=1 Tax=Klebsiella aerogenes TaxID=548 RepID=UPI002DBF5A96|nr:protein tyrosine phosphatase [Klebsiella aerogenes]HBT3181197.1 protein tyrosine phosphatase [Klebsiella aerogenes]